MLDIHAGKGCPVHKSRRILSHLRHNRVESAKLFVRQDQFPTKSDLSASNENAPIETPVEHIPDDPTDPAPTAGIRVPTTLEARTARGTTIYNKRVVHFESELEHRSAKIMQARCDVVNVISQPYKVQYTDEEGEIAHHIFDFHLDFADALRVAVAVKPASKVAKLAALLARVELTGRVVREDGSLGELSEMFDKIAIITEEWASLDAYHNATSILWALKKPKAQACPIVRERAMSIVGTKTRYIDLIAGLDDDGPRRITFWLLVYEGVLTPVETCRIDELTWMTVTDGHLAAPG